MVKPASIKSPRLALSDDPSSMKFTAMVLKAKPDVLSIIEAARALFKGYAFQLFARLSHLRFAIGHETLSAVNFHISSKLMRLSRQLD